MYVAQAPARLKPSRGFVFYSATGRGLAIDNEPPGSDGDSGKMARYGKVATTSPKKIFSIKHMRWIQLIATSASDAVDGSSTGTRVPRMWALLRLPRFRGASHADDHDNRSRHCQVSIPGSRSWCRWWGGIRRQLKRRYVLAFFEKLPPCLVGIEACASSHYWSRELQALGHTVRLMPPAYVKPYVKRQKNEGDEEQSRDDFFFGREGLPRQQFLARGLDSPMRGQRWMLILLEELLTPALILVFCLQTRRNADTSNACT
jgi:hypothetical protein